jgi:hypothetical protein
MATWARKPGSHAVHCTKQADQAKRTFFRTVKYRLHAHPGHFSDSFVPIGLLYLYLLPFLSFLGTHHLILMHCSPQKLIRTEHLQQVYNAACSPHQPQLGQERITRHLQKAVAGQSLHRGSLITPSANPVLTGNHGKLHRGNSSLRRAISGGAET